MPAMSDAPLPSSFDGDEDFYSENRWQKFTRRLREEPLIPLGCLLTCWALVGAGRSMKAGDHYKTNRMFRRRIYAQGFTIVAMVAGSMYWQEDREKRKEFDELQAQKKAQEKRDNWLRELEARDEEEKAFQAKLEKKKQLNAERAAQGKVGDVTKAVEEKKALDEKAAAAALTETKSALEPSETRGVSVVEAVKDLLARRS